MNVLQFTPRTTSDLPGMFEPLRSLSGLRPGDSIEQIGLHAARLAVELPAEHESVSVRRDGRALLVVDDLGSDVLRRFDLAEGVTVSGTRHRPGCLEIDCVRETTVPDIPSTMPLAG